MSRPEIVEDVIAAAAAVPQALDRLSEEARAAWAGQLAADVAAERRASGVTVAPEAALHRALQARTDELERVRAELAEARAENASLLAVVPPGTHVARVEWGVHAEVTRQRDEILRLTRERDEARAEIARWRTEVEARGTTVTVLRDVASSMLASITRFAEAAAAHDANADVFVDDEYHISTRALVEEFCREHGHPLTHEWATAKLSAPDGGAPTAPDVALPCAPAAGAADPLRLSGTSRPPATWWPASDTRTRTRTR